MPPNFPPEIHDRHPELHRWAILHAYRGSVAHGTYVPNSDPDSIDDVDTMAIVVPSLRHYLGLDSYGSRGTREIRQGPWDIVVRRNPVYTQTQGFWAVRVDGTETDFSYQECIRPSTNATPAPSLSDASSSAPSPVRR